MPRNIKYLDRILQFKNFVCCQSCRKDCKDDPLICNVCCKWFHRKCEGNKARMNKKLYQEYQVKKNFICSNKCYNSILPFSDTDYNGLICTFQGDGSLFCKKCRWDCVKKILPCNQCVHCLNWFHKECTDDDRFLICSPKCMAQMMVFSNIVDSDF